jgi:hypothetical protein
MIVQPDLFHEILPPADPLHGLIVRVPDSCKCGAARTTIGAGAGPHTASLRCVNCGAHRGWLAHETHSFIGEIVRLVGRPTEPIAIRRGRNGVW